MWWVHQTRSRFFPFRYVFFYMFGIVLHFVSLNRFAWMVSCASTDLLLIFFSSSSSFAPAIGYRVRFTRVHTQSYEFAVLAKYWLFFLLLTFNRQLHNNCVYCVCERLLSLCRRNSTEFFHSTSHQISQKIIWTNKESKRQKTSCH